jgi:hypothetical protein
MHSSGQKKTERKERPKESQFVRKKKEKEGSRNAHYLVTAQGTAAA